MKFYGELTLFTISEYEKRVAEITYDAVLSVDLDLNEVDFLDSAGAIFLNNILNICNKKNIVLTLFCQNHETNTMLELVKKQNLSSIRDSDEHNKNILYQLGEYSYSLISGFLSFMFFVGRLFSVMLGSFIFIKNIRYKEIAFEINDSAIKALGIVMLSSFLIGVVTAYQSAYQLKIYGANIFIVNVMGLSILRELAPIITAIIIAGRSGSSYTAQIGAMKITQELDAMETMGFDPYLFLVLPRITALIIAMPILIFISDIMGMLGGVLVAYLDLGITPELFIDRFSEVIAAKHFFVGIVKGPFFAFLIATIGIHRGLMVKNDTQSIGLNTTRSVVESLFAVIVCDAIFSIIFTNLGI